MYKDEHGKEYYGTTKKDEAYAVASATKSNVFGRFSAAAGLIMLFTIAFAILPEFGGAVVAITIIALFIYAIGTLLTRILH